ncbi:MAG: Imm21 family immunity protein [Myxococcales bacterium]
MSSRESRTRWIATDGGPLIVLPVAKQMAWRGSFVEGEDGDFVVDTPGGKYAFRTDYDFENPRTDYERACAVAGLAGALVVDGSMALVLGDEPLQTTWLALPTGGMFAAFHTVEPGADIDAELSTLAGAAADWQDAGLALLGGEYVLMDAVDHGAVPERDPFPVTLEPGAYEVASASVETGLVSWRCVRLARAQLV